MARTGESQGVGAFDVASLGPQQIEGVPWRVQEGVNSTCSHGVPVPRLPGGVGELPRYTVVSFLLGGWYVAKEGGIFTPLELHVRVRIIMSTQRIKADRYSCANTKRLREIIPDKPP